MRYDLARIRDSVAPRDVLDAHGVEFRGSRGPCPLCHTSETSQAFAVYPQRWRCYACGAKGDSIDLEAAFVGSKGEAIRGLAARLGMTSQTPADLALTLAKDRERKAVREAEAEQAEINRARWLGRVSRVESLRARIAQVGAYGPRPFVWSVLENLYRLLGETEARLDQTQFDVRSWKVQDDPSFPRPSPRS
jgi:hypothetical protein